jgi:membrane-associated phospholipid phosphatase
VLRIFALVVTIVFQPLLMPALVFGMILFAVPEATSIPEEFKLRIFYLILLSTLLIPMVTIIGLRLSGVLKSLHMPEIKDRTVPFLITCLYFIFTSYFLYQKSELDEILWKGMGVMSLSVIVLTLVSFFWKMSAHMTGLGGMFAVLLVLGKNFPTFNELYPALLTIVLCGIVASSRLYLNAHRPLEVYIGFFTGFVICWLGFSLIWA